MSQPWIDWHGADWDGAPDYVVEVKCRSGVTEICMASEVAWFKDNWSANREDIVAYRSASLTPYARLHQERDEV